MNQREVDVMKEKKQPLKDGEVRVIKISEDALLEFIEKRGNFKNL